MAKCFICGKELDEKTRPEHIIPNGIGGKLKSKKILCNQHNNEFSKLDELVCNDLMIQTNMLNPNRDHGKNPDVICELSDGSKVKMKPTGEYYAQKPIIKIEEDKNKNIQFHFSTFYSKNSTHKEIAKQQFKNALEGYCNKCGFPKDFIQSKLNEFDITFEKSIATNFSNTLFLQSQFNKSGNLFLGISKIALDYYFYNNLPQRNVGIFLNKFMVEDIEFINSNSNYYYDEDLLLPNSIYHLLILKGDKNNKLLYCIISLYGVLNCIVFLNKNYEGEDILKTYSYDLLNQKEITLNKNPQITQSMLENILKTKRIFEETKKAHELFMSFFEYGSAKKRKEDCIEFATNIQNEIENMNTLPLIYSNREFQEVFEEIFYRNINKNETLGQLTDREKQNIFQDLSLQQNAYECYLQSCFPHFIINKLYQLIEIILTNDIQLCENENSFIKYLSDSISSVKTGNDYINCLIVKNSDNINAFIRECVKLLKPLTETLLKNFHRNNTKTVYIDFPPQNFT